MSKSKQVSVLAERIEQSVPQLSFTAYYRADDPMLMASMRSYKKRAFVYVLAVDFEEREEYIYVGQSMSQYSRMLQHMATFSFHRVYLFECTEDDLDNCEERVIRLLVPLFNRQHNPKAMQYQRVLNIDYEGTFDEKTTARYLAMWKEYRAMGLYGFVLPPVLYAILKEDANGHGRTVSDELVDILEAVYAEKISASMVGNRDYQRTNLVTTMEYGSIHGKSQEQIKQYLYQEDRLSGRKIGRDWILLEDTNFPEDRRERAAMY